MKVFGVPGVFCWGAYPEPPPSIPQKKHRHGFLHGAFEEKDEGNLFHYFICIWLSIFFQMGGDYRPTRLKPNCGRPVAKNRQGVQWNEDRRRTDWITWWIHHRLMILMVWMVAIFTGQYRSRFRYHYIYPFSGGKTKHNAKVYYDFPLTIALFWFCVTLPTSNTSLENRRSFPKGNVSADHWF